MIDKVNCNQNIKFDKDVSNEISRAMAADPELNDECAGWHVICGKSFASAIQYQTENVLFFDLLGGNNKTFLIFKTQWGTSETALKINYNAFLKKPDLQQ